MATRKPSATELKTEANYYLIEMGYQNKIILPFDAGIAFLQSLKLAEKYNQDKWADPFIEPLPLNMVEAKIISREEYIRLKSAHLLGIPSSELDLSPQAA